MPGLPVRLHRIYICALTCRGDLSIKVATEHNIGTSTCHVGRNRDRTGTTGLLHDYRLTLVLLRIQYLVLDAFLLQQRRQ